MFEDYYFKSLTYLKIKGICLIADIDIWENKQLQSDVFAELFDNGYILMNDSSVWLSTKGFNYLACFDTDRLPIIPPYTEAETTHKHKYQKGIFIVKILSNDWIKLILTSIIALVIGTYILVKLKIIK